MKKTLFFLLTVLLFVGCCHPSSSRDAASPAQQLVYGADCSDAFYLDRLALIDSAYATYIKEGYMPQCVGMVIQKGRVVYEKAFGWRDIEQQIPCQTTDLFRMASQSKAIVCVGLMTLWEEGKFQLDEPITKYFPEFAQMEVLDTYDAASNTWTSHPAKKALTIRHFITHTSGLCIDGYFDKIADKLGVPTHMCLDSITLRESIQLLAQMPLKHEPGEDFTYACNTNVLGALIEELSGQDLYTFLQERIFEPCGMTDTYFYLPEDKQDRLVTLYQYPKDGQLERVEGIYQEYPYTGARVFCSPSAGMVGSIQDYAKFCQMILNGGTFNGHRIIGRKTLEMMQKNGTGTMRGEIGFGMAWDVFTPEYAHNTVISEGSMRWGGMFGTDYVIDPAEQLIILMYVNNMPNFSGYNPKTLMHQTVYQALK